MIWCRVREGTFLWGRFIAAFVLLVLSGGRAEAEKQDPVGVLEVATRGVSETAGDTFEQGMERALSAVEVPVVRSQRVREQMGGSDFVRGCTFGPCLREVGRATGLNRLLVARIEGAGKSYSVVVSLLETEEGRLLSQVAQSCPVCTVDEAIATATQAVVELLTRREGEARSGEEVVDVPDDGGARIAKKKKHVRRTGAVFVAAGAAALVVGAILAGNDSDAGAPLVGGGVALAGAGLATLLLSVTF